MKGMIERFGHCKKRIEIAESHIESCKEEKSGKAIKTIRKDLLEVQTFN
jgi:hypothetical protein